MKKAGASARSRRASSPLSSPIPVTAGRSSVRFLVLVPNPAQEFVVASVVLILGSCLIRRITTIVPPSHRRSEMSMIPNTRTTFPTPKMVLVLLITSGSGRSKISTL